MHVHRRVLVSGPRDEWLDPARRQLKHSVIARIRKAKFEPQYFDVRGVGDLVKGQAWSLDHVDSVIRRCVGVVLLGLTRWRVVLKGRSIALPSEYRHYEGSLAYTYNLPILALAETDIDHRGIFIPYGLPVVPIPRHAGSRWLREPDFTNAFTNWESELKQRRDVFLGYSGRSKVLAARIHRYFRRLGVTLLDWNQDFAPADSILERIRQASARCSAGVFLFTSDDHLAGGEMAPRDNVVLEAGFFMHAKGRGRVLIVREGRSKMPADLGGDIYAPLTDRSNISPIKPVLRKFVECL